MEESIFIFVVAFWLMDASLVVVHTPTLYTTFLFGECRHCRTFCNYCLWASNDLATDSPLSLVLLSSTFISLFFHCCILFFIQPSVSTLSNHQTCLSVSRFLAALYLLVLEVTNMTNMNSLKAVFCFAVCYLATLSSGVGKFCLIPSPTRHPIWSVLP